MKAAVVPSILFSLAPELDWQEQALCAQVGPGAFFPEKGSSTRDAKSVCRLCPVQAECLEYALTHDEQFGVWGGTSERERRRLRGSSSGARTGRADDLCGRGLHVLVGANVIVRRDGSRRCQPCRRATDARRAARQRVARSGAEGA